MIGRSEGSIDRIRNIGIAAHIDAGKTTTTERILFYTGKTHRMGEVDDGESEMDWMDLERERGITISSASTSCAWRGHRINIIDTPGHVDFTAEVERSLRVLDGAICVFCAVAGVQPQSEAIWRQAARHQVPMLIFVNKMDRAGARFDGVVEEIRRTLGAKALPVQMPLRIGGLFAGVVDLVRLAALQWGDDPLGARFKVGGVPPELREEAELRRMELLDGLSEVDDAFLARWVGGSEASEAEIQAALRRATLARKAFPVLCGAALRNRGVQPLLDAVVDYLPSPAQSAKVTARLRDSGESVECPADELAPLVALAFKVVGDAHVGKLTYLRLYSGRLRSGSRALNASRGVEERVARLLRMHANEREELREASAGDIVAAVGLRATGTGDTLCAADRAVLLEPISFPEPMVSVVIEPRTREAQERLAEGVARFEEEDPTFRGRFDAETGQVVVSGMGELHLDVILERLAREQGVRVNVGSPQVAYRETFGRGTEAEETVDRRAGLKSQFAHVFARFDPVAPEKGLVFEAAESASCLPAGYILAVKAGVEQAAASGTLAGYPVVGVRATLHGGSYREADSSEEAFAAVGALAFRRAMERSEPVLMEPVVDVEIVVPEESLGDVVAQLGGKQAVIEGVEQHEGRMRVRASVALREMLGYASELRSASKGRGTHRAQFRGYRKAPALVAEEIVRRARGELR